MPRLLAIAVITALAPLAPADSTVERFLARDAAPLVEFVAHRRLEARNDRLKAAGWLEACVTQDASGFSYRVTAEGGSGYVRNRALRKALDGERELVRTGAPASAALTTANYEMATVADVEPLPLGEAAIRLRPKRRDVLLIDGRVVVTDPEGDLLRIEGRLSKAPSFWTTAVTVVRRYDRVAGVRVPVETESTADVRIVGRSHFRMRASFVTVNGITVESAPESARRACLVTQN
jgi:hypothetical protein